jgi:hypothetical protein
MYMLYVHTTCITTCITLIVLYWSVLHDLELLTSFLHYIHIKHIVVSSLHGSAALVHTVSLTPLYARFTSIH